MKEKRELPRNVDGSFKVFSVMPLKNNVRRAGAL